VSDPGKLLAIRSAGDGVDGLGVLRRLVDLDVLEFLNKTRAANSRPDQSCTNRRATESSRLLAIPQHSSDVLFLYEWPKDSMVRG
jgi:hypothetical protein